MTQTIFGIVAIDAPRLCITTITPIVRVLAFKIGAVDVPLTTAECIRNPSLESADLPST